MRKLAKLPQARGVTLVEVLLILGVTTVVVGVATSLITQVINNQKHNNYLSQLYILQGDYISILQDNRAWQQTVNAAVNSSAMKCLKNKINCSPTAVTAFTPVGSDGNLINGYDPLTKATDGFDEHGNHCTTFNTTNPDSCTTRVTFTWQPINTAKAPCTSASCVNPQIEIKMNFSFAIANNSPLRPAPNPANYNVPSAYVGNLYRTGTEAYVVPSPASCPSRSVVTGFNANGTPICSSVPTYFPKPSPPCTCPKGGCGKGGCTKTGK